jgi:N-acetylmuramoyl-L-alanine amidase
VKYPDDADFEGQEVSELWVESEDEGDEREPPDPGDEGVDAAERQAPPDPDEAPRAGPRPRPVPAADAPEPPCTVTIGQGDCIFSLAGRYRRTADQIWNAPENAELRAKRTRNVLLPGDRVFIPAVASKQVDAATEKRHRFKLKRATTKLELKLLRGGEPRANLAYELRVGERTWSGQTRADGGLEAEIPADAREGTLRLLEPGDEETLPLRFGELNPADDAAGVQARLSNLGFACGAIDGQLGPRTRAALAAFQRAHGLRPTGEVDPGTRARLVEVHGS